MKFISLSKGKVAKVDDEDYSALSRYNWFSMVRKGKWYARRNARINGKHKTILMHRQILSAPEHLVTDHKNGDGLDNRRENLRLCTDKQNSQNQGPRPNNTSGYRGVSWHKRERKWRADIMVDGKYKQVGSYTAKEDAARAYNQAAIKYFGEFAHLNLLEEDR